MTTNYQGASLFQRVSTITASATFGVTLSSMLDGAGNGVASELASRNLSIHYVHADGSTGTNTVPLNLSIPSLPFQLGNFQVTEQLPVSLLG